MSSNLVIELILIIFISFLIYFRYLKFNFYRHLFELEEAFDSELDFIHLSKNILVRVMKETAASAGIIYWYDETQHEFKLKTLNGIPADKVNQVTRELRKSDGILEKAQRHPEAIKIDNTKNDSSLSDLSEIYRSLMVIPLNIQKRSLGILILLKTNSEFSRTHLKWLTLFAPRSAVRLDNSRLYQLAKETALENARLYINISKLYQQATLDELTGLYNRNFLMQRVKEELKKALRFKQPLSLIFADLDFFKLVNDEFGHQVGDQLLTEFSEFIKNSVREYDVACRFGGEEFVVLLPHTTLVNAYDLAERLRKKLAKHIFCGVKNIKITASFGVSTIPEGAEMPPQFDEENLNVFIENLISAADDALYNAKKTGRNRVVASGDLPTVPGDVQNETTISNS